jgi:methyl-accepting chemotaxis protein
MSAKRISKCSVGATARLGSIRGDTKVSFSIRWTLLLIISAFIIGLLALAIVNLTTALDSMSGAQAMRTNNAISSDFLEAAGVFAAERGFTNAALAAKSKATPDVLSKIALLRVQGNKALAGALEQVRAADFEGKDTQIEKVLGDQQALQALRGAVDQQLAQDFSTRDGAVAKKWVPTMTALIMSSQRLRIAAQATPAAALARTQIMLDLRQAMWVVSEYAGRERAMVGGLIGRKAKFDVDTTSKLSEFRGRLEQSWALIEGNERREYVDPAVRQAIATARSEFFGKFDEIRRSVYLAGAGEGEYPLTADKWVASATRGIDSLLAVSDAIGEATSNNTLLIENGGRNAVVVSAIVLVVAVSLGAFSFWVVIMRIIRPIQSLTRTMSRLADGDFNIKVPSVARGDEIGQMARAVEVFLDAGINNRRLETEAEQGRETAERERRNREAQKESEARDLETATTALGAALGKLAEGDLGLRIEQPFVPALEKVRGDFNIAVERLRAALANIGANARAIAAGSAEISSAADDLSKRTEKQAASVEQTAAALEQITTTMADSSRRAEDAGRLVETTRSDAEKSGVVVRKAIAAMGEIETSSKEISNIIGVIDEIAFQTNLLALNAGVEAARAGDAGKGFAVVAQEVRELAQRSAKAAKEIKALINVSGEHVRNGVALVDQTGHALEQIVGQVKQINTNVAAIVESSKEQATGLKEINTAVNTMDQGTQENAAMVEETTAASHNLALEAESLFALLGQFTVVSEHSRARFVEPVDTDHPSLAHRLPGRPARAVGYSFSGHHSAS